MSKKKKEELTLFLGDNNRIAYSGLCRKCQMDCKQPFRAVVVYCPKYLSKRSGRAGGG